MARSDITVQTVDENAGTQVTYEAANVDGNAYPNTGSEIVHVINGSGGSITVTAVTPATQAGLAIADLAVAIPAGEDRFIGRLSKKTFNQPSGADADKVYLDYSSVTSLTVAVLRP